MRLLEYNEPHPSGGNCRVRMTRQQAIDWTVTVRKSIMTEQKALDDFIVTHWAYWVEED